MNKEQQELLDEVYNKWIKYSWNSRIYPNQNDKDIFIDRIKTEPDFSINWGLKIEERELSHDERFRIAYKNLELRKKLEAQSKMLHYPDGHNKVMDDANIPTRLITITYNDKTIESYE
jgi:hypothetical protein